MNGSAIKAFSTNPPGVPLLSVVTVHLDDFGALDQTMASLPSREQQPELEWIVVDGGSRPENEQDQQTLQQARSRADRFLEGPDDGIYDAMNKGTSEARGRWLLYLNAGDRLHADFSLSRLAEHIGDDAPAMIWGQCFDQDREGRCYPRKTRAPAWLKLGMPVSHQAVLFDRQALGPAPYRADLKFAGDYELLCRFYTAGAYILRSDIPVCVFELSGRSSRNKRASLAEEAAVRSRYFGGSLFASPAIVRLKLLGWRLNEWLPGLRRAWRRWV